MSKYLIENLFGIEGWSIAWYGVIIAVGMVLGVILAIYHRFFWQLLILTVQKIGYCLIRKAVCFHRIPIGKPDDLCCAVLKIK